jgi:1-aminocyclopropane-1-carboxylate deaminase/D-cysteine desulfhydrase-like pyridoxal-dependent ACC family enzyme
MFSKSADNQWIVTSTPIEEYEVGQRRVYVKREDLCCRPPAPPLGKLRGLEHIVNSYVANKVRIIGCWDTRVSKLGQGLAALVGQFEGVEAIVCYPRLKNGPVPSAIQAAEKLGATIVSMRGNHVSICFAQASEIVKKKGGVMIPFGLDCAESVTAIASEANSVPYEVLDGGTVVLSCGSAVTLSGLLKGFDPKPRKVIGISSGRSVAKLQKCIQRHCGEIPKFVKLIPASIPYDAVPTQESPFPTHPNYDLKAWKYLVENIHRLTPPILFWNIGA